MNKITPCLWFDGEAKEVAEFYCSLFDGHIYFENEKMVEFTLNRRPFLTLNGGPHFKINESISFFVYCGSEKRIQELYSQLRDGGQVLMELTSYPWSRKYAWVKDKFGVSWQLDVDPINNAQNIVPAVMFVNDNKLKIKEAIDFYHSFFPEPIELFKAYYDETTGLPEGAIQFAQHKLAGNIFNFMSSQARHEWELNEGISFVIKCEDQKELDHYWDNLTSNGGKEGRCGWLKDRYGISWQVIPKNLDTLITSDTARRKMLSMNKINLAAFEN